MQHIDLMRRFRRYDDESPVQSRKQRAEIETQVAEYQARGGQVVTIPRGVSAQQLRCTIQTSRPNANTHRQWLHPDRHQKFKQSI